MKLVFDLGGVVIKWTPRSFVAELCGLDACQSAQTQIFDAVFQNFNPDSDWSKFDRDTLTAQQLATRIYVRLKLSKLQSNASESSILEWISALPERMPPIEETVNWIERLHQSDIPLYFLSNMPKPFVPYLLRHEKIFSKFEDGIFSCDVGLAKPQMEIFEMAHKRFGFAHADRVVFIDDHQANIDAARQFGWGAIHHLDVQQSISLLHRLR
ncbi:MAG: hypothetical protein EB072_14170 [Betaproteobacteria bacterium]|nr:hypothetical protein [Betaproteobacteria bacterium]